jgi:glyoxylate reductase
MHKALPRKRREGLLRESDFVSLHTSLTPQTHHLINTARLALMKPTAVLVNTSRGPVIDEQALAQALQQGQIFTAWLDVFEREPGVHPALLACDNAVLIPHLGSATVTIRLAMADLAVGNLLAALEARHPPGLLNPAGLGAQDLRRVSLLSCPHPRQPS